MLFIGFLFLQFLHANTGIDSLNSVLSSLKGKEKIPILNELVKEYSGSHEYQKAIDHLKEIIFLTEQGESDGSISSYYKRLGKLYLREDNYEAALKNFELALDLFRQQQDRSNIAEVISEMGYVNQSQGNYLKANELYNRALQIFEQTGDSLNIALILNRIGSTHKFNKEYDKALEYYESALQIRKQLNYKRGIAGSYNNIAMIYMFQEKYQKALELYFEALKLNKEMENDEWISFNLNNIGYLYYLQKDYQKALDHMTRSLQIKRNLKDTRGEMHTLGNIASVQNILGNLELSEKYFLKSLELAKQLGSKQHILQCYRDLALHNEQIGNYRLAYDYLSSYIALNDTLFNQEKITAIQEIQTKYETTKKEREIEILKKNSQIRELQLRRNRILKFTFIIGFILILALALIIYFSYHRAKIEIEKRKVIQRELNDLNKNLETRVETEVSKRRAQEQKAVEQSRLAALGELAAGIAHEINQPLHSIAFSMDNMSLALEEDDADKNYIQQKTQRIFEDIERMKRIVDHIRTFSRKQTEEEKTPFDINRSVTSALNMIKEQYANHRIDLEVDLYPKLCKVLGNIYRFEQVVLILLSNGKYAVEKQAEKEDEDFRKILQVKTYQQQEYVCLEFADNGTGIPEQDLNRIFDPFFTTKKTDKGTGLGLSIASGIVSDMNGIITVQSEVGKGTIFLIKLKKDTNE